MIENDEDAYRFGQICGDAILALFKAIAAADGMTVVEAMDKFVSGYVAERIINPEGS